MLVSRIVKKCGNPLDNSFKKEYNHNIMNVQKMNKE